MEKARMMIKKKVILGFLMICVGCTTSQPSKEHLDISQLSEEYLENIAKEEIVVFDTEEYAIKITGFGRDLYEEDNYIVEIACENKSENKKFLFLTQYAGINGIQYTPSWGHIFSPKTKANTEKIIFSAYNLKRYGISKYYDLDDFTDIEITFTVVETIAEPVQLEIIDEKNIHIYPKGEEQIQRYEKKIESTDVISLDNEHVAVLVTGYEKNIIANDTIQFCVINKTDKRILLRAKKVSANGKILKELPETQYDISVNAGNCAFSSFEFLGMDYFQEQDIKQLEEVTILWQTYFEDDLEEPIREDLVSVIISNH